MKRWFARKLLQLAGWTIEGSRPEHRRFVLIAAPHTSNWDFPLMLVFAAAFDLKVTWMAKHKLFIPPIGWIMRFMGGIPIKRDRNSNMVGSLVEAFAINPGLILVIPTEGTRQRTEHWKSGFYHIARGAGVPIVPSYLDYSQKRGGFGPALEPVGDVSEDMSYFRDFYAPMKGLFPERFGPVRLREESTA